ncbi:MAG: hypothetical protein LBD37_02880, partial [Treponema sp.]|nr:hypothetical protein [Treponema sp.]
MDRKGLIKSRGSRYNHGKTLIPRGFRVFPWFFCVIRVYSRHSRLNFDTLNRCAGWRRIDPFLSENDPKGRIEAEIPQKSRRLFEELERIARFFAA